MTIYRTRADAIAGEITWLITGGGDDPAHYELDAIAHAVLTYQQPAEHPGAAGWTLRPGVASEDVDGVIAYHRLSEEVSA